MILTPPGTLCGATHGNAEKRNRLRYPGLASPVHTAATLRSSLVMRLAIRVCSNEFTATRTATFSDTHWYAMDKATSLDDPKPPKKAQFRDALVRARTRASKLVAGAGLSGSQVRSSVLCFVAICRENSVAQGGFDAKTGAHLLQPPKKLC